LAGRPRFQRPSLLPWAGLVLFAGCLYGLLSGSRQLTTPSTLTGPAAPGGVIVVIDPGHGGTDSGAVAQGVIEKDLNLDVGLRVARVLAASGLQVRLTREDDHFVPLETRVEMANALPGAIFVSIHFNDAQGEGRATNRASGIETYYSGVKQVAPASDFIWTSLFRGAKPAANWNPADAVRAGALLADSIQHSLIANTSATDRGIKEAGLYVTRRVRGPAVLVEGGFVSHPQEARLLQDPVYRQRIANSIAEGIVKFLEMVPPPAAGGSPAPRA
jgi:N-acetylmuramoyl-L-alanine amidase